MLKDDHFTLPVLCKAVDRGTSPAIEPDQIDSRAAREGTAQPSSYVDFGWGISIVFRAFRQMASVSLTDLPGGPRGYLVLSAVAHDLPRSQLALAQQLAVDKTAMTYLLDGLEEAGLVERRPDPADRRQRQIVLTPTGRSALEEFSERLGQAEQRLLSALAPEEAHAFRQFLDRVARSTQQDTEPCTVEKIPNPGDGLCP